jgi:hypothetical protein
MEINGKEAIQAKQCDFLCARGIEPQKDMW